jgi:hypothetical protein
LWHAHVELDWQGGGGRPTQEGAVPAPQVRREDVRFLEAIYIPYVVIFSV